MKKYTLLFFTFLMATWNVVGQSINPPSLVTPANGAGNVFVSVILDWSAVSNNQGYIYEIDITSSFNSSLKLSGTSGRNSSNNLVSNLLFGQTYYWRVATISSVDTSVWSVTRSFTTINEPVLVRPLNNESNINPTINLDWALLSGAQFFLYEVDTTLNFNSALKISGATSTNTSNVTVSDLRFNRTYYWRVAAATSSDTSDWSFIRSFQTIASPVLVSPTNGSTNRDAELNLDWGAVTGNTGYIYQIDSTINFNSPLLRIVNSATNTSQATVSNLRFGTTYFWRVAIKTPSDTSQWSTIYRFTTTDQVSLVSPSNNSTNQDISETLDWSFVGGNNGYIYEIDTVASFNSPALQQNSFTSNTSQATVNNLRFGTTYYWRVAVKTVSDTSAWSVVYSFLTLDQLSLSNPSNGSVNQNVTELLDWQGIVGNAGYIYEIDTVITFNSPALSTNSFTANSSQATVNNLRFGTTYFWRVAAKSLNDTTQWSSTFSFTTRDNVILVSPNDNATLFAVQTNLDWGGIPGIIGYIYELDSTLAFNSPLLRNVGTTNNVSQATVSNLNYGTTYYWRVAAFTINDTSGWSPVRSFTTRGNVALTAPTNNSTLTSIRPTLDWSSLTGSNGYIYELDTNATFNSPLFFSAAFTGITSQVNAPLLRYGTTYYWRVKATTTIDTSEWSDIRNFTTFDHVNLSFPVNNASNLSNTVSISWGARFDGTHYIYEVDENPLFNSPNIIVGNTAGISPIGAQGTRANITNLRYGQDYYWRVAAVSAIDTSGWGTIRKFSTAFLLPNAPTLLFPANGATNVQRRNLVLDWTDDTNATGYQVQLDTVNNFNATTGVGNRNSSNWTLSRRENNTTYYWRVRSTNNSGNSPWSAVWSFTTEDCDNSDTLVITNCGSYLYRGVFYSNSGLYTRTFQNAAACDSTVYLDLTINQATLSNLNLTSCDSLVLNGQSFYSSGNYVQTITNAKGCDSTINVNLTIHNSVNQTIPIQACDSFVWARTGLTYFSSGIYADTLRTTKGCDSIAVLDLTISPTSNSFTTIVACDSFVWRGNTIFQTGIYRDTISNSLNCDSIIELDLTIYQSVQSSQTVDVCNQFNWNGQLLTSSGTYFDTLSTTNGCDSLITLNLTVRDSTHNRVVISACDSITINGQLITQTAIYTQVLTNSVGCDSVLTLDVTINNTTSSTAFVSACNSYLWTSTNRVYNATGLYDTTFQSVSGCDSTVRLDLTITNISIAVQQNGFVLTATQANATYQWLDCNNGNTPITGETGRVFTAQQNGSYAVEVSRGNCLDTSNCVVINTVGLADLNEDKHKVKVYPNPTNDIVTIDLGVLSQRTLVELFDVKGQLVQSNLFQNSTLISLPIEGKNGVYILKLTYNDRVEVTRVVKN